MMRKSEEFDLLDVAVREKSYTARIVYAKSIFGTYCRDLRDWVNEMASAVKERNMVGLHPFMVGDFYDGDKDKIAAILMSALIPLDDRMVLGRVGSLKKLMDDSPWNFIQGAYKVKNYSLFYNSIGCAMWQMQQWTDILHKVLMGPVSMIFNNIDYYVRADGMNVTPSMSESLAEARFWLEENVLGTEKKDMHVPMTRIVREAISAWVPRYKMIGWQESVRLFDMPYDAMFFYAAEGRKRLYRDCYDDIYRMEHNLESKVKRGTRMDGYERWRFRTLFLKKLYSDLEIPYM